MSDQGPGVSDADLDRIFLPFCRGSDPASQVGYGLGLAIARHAVETHGGTIHAERSIEGGLCVVMTFPKEQIGRLDNA